MNVEGSLVPMQDATPSSPTGRLPARPNFSGLSLRDLEYVVALADHGSVALAAAHCHVAGPSLSVQVRRIEERLDTRLFERRGRRLVPTAASVGVVEQMRRVLREGAALLALASRPPAPFDGRLRLSALQTLAPYFFPLAAARVRAAFPTVELQLGEVGSQAARAMLHAGEIDVALLSSTTPAAGIAYRTLFRERLLVAVPAGHRLAQASHVSWSGLAGDERLLLDEGHCLHDLSVALARSRTSTRPSPSLESLRYRVAAGEGCALVPAFAATPCDGVIYRQANDPGCHRDVVLAWRDDAGASIDEENLTCLVTTLWSAGMHAGALEP